MSETATMSVVGYVRNESTQKRINELLGSRAPQLTTSLITALNSNDRLANCTPQSVLNAALTAASMDLPINQNLGFAYIVPYGNEAQFQMGWKGFVQLAQRSGFYKTINATDVREGELKSRNRLSGEIEFEWIEGEAERKEKPIVGYVAYFELLNGFSKTLYMSMDDIEAHAYEYSKSYSYDKDKHKRTSNWSTNFNAMAVKTVIKLLISKYGPQNTQLQEAITKDQAVIDDEGIKYIDNDELPPMSAKEKELSRSKAWLEKRFKDEGYDTLPAQKAFIKMVTGKEEVETQKEVDEVTEQLNAESETYVDPTEALVRDSQL